MSIQKATLFEWALGQRKQSDIFTAIAAANLNTKIPYRSFSAAQLSREFRSDKTYFGKGHDFATFVEPTSEVLSFSREFEANTAALCWALSLLMGSVSTTGTSPKTHTIRFCDPATQKECLYTSIIEKAGSEYQNLISGMWLESVSLSAKGSDMITLAVNARARKQATDATSLPGVTQSNFFKSNFATFNFSAYGGSSVISEQVLGWELNLGQGPDLRWMPGQTSGEEPLVRYALIGEQTVGGSITVFLSSTLRNLLINNQYCQLVITNKGINDAGEQLIITIPKFKIKTESLAQDASTTALTLAFDQETVVKDSGIAASPVSIDIVTKEVTALLQ